MSPADTTLTPPPVAIHAGCAWPWRPDTGNGEFRNPILHADYSDPDVIRHGDDFYMTASSFNCTPGLPLLHSRDLVNWTLINHAVKNLPHARYEQVQPGCGIWAPSMRFHDGKFWIFFPMPDEGIYVTTATDPAGQWTEPHLLQAGKGLIDPCPLWDDDGQAYLVHAYARSRSGIKHRLRVCPMSPDGSRLLGEGRIVFDDPEKHPTLEGPKFLKRDGWYYILAPAGGVATGWQVVLRSRDVYGPYEDKIVLEQGGTAINGPHQGALIDTPNGQWWFIHFQDAGLYGRIAHLQPARWDDGWPLMGLDQDGNGVGEPVLNHEKPDLPTAAQITPPTSDEFDGSRLGLQWQWNANHRDDWLSLAARPGWLRLFAQPVPQNDLARAPHLLLQKFPARAFAVKTRVDLQSLAEGTEAGLVVMGLEHAALAAVREGNTCNIVFRIGGNVTRLTNSSTALARFRVLVSDGGQCRFAYAFGEGEFTPVPTTFQAREGTWIGARVGLYSACASATDVGHADFDCFRFSAP